MSSHDYITWFEYDVTDVKFAFDNFKINPCIFQVIKLDYYYPSQIHLF